MNGYFVVTEDINDGMWFDDPMFVDSLDEARALARKLKAGEGYDIVIYSFSAMERISA